MAKTGGARPGAGRKPGSLNRRSAKLVDDAASEGTSPIEYMLAIMRDETADTKRRDWAAERAAAFVHPRPAPAQRAVIIDLPPVKTAGDIPEALSYIVAAVGKGEIAPGEAQSLVAIVDAQRKAIETHDLVRRLEELEKRLSPAG